MSKKLVSFKAKGKNVRFYAKNPGAAWHREQMEKYYDLAEKEDPGSWKYYKQMGRASAHSNSNFKSEDLNMPNPISNSSLLPIILVIGGIGLIWWLAKKNSSIQKIADPQSISPTGRPSSYVNVGQGRYNEDYLDN